jgi:hypothetical protein
MKWRDPGIGGTTKILRQIVPLATFAMPSGFQFPAEPDVTPYDWQVIGVKEPASGGIGDRYFWDEDIPEVDESLPKAARRPLGSVYTYRLEISGGEGSARSEVIATRIRGINGPDIESIDGISDSEIHVSWRDFSKLASGYRVRFFQSETGFDEGAITINGTTRRDQVITGLSPDTEYVVTVTAWDHYGSSGDDSAKARTKPAADAKPEDMTFDLRLIRQIVYEGHIPYLGRFPTAGYLPSGTLRKVSLGSTFPALLFVKPGESTADCGDPNAVVLLAPGNSLTAAEMTELFGSETPDLPIVFLACAQFTPTLYDYIPIRITYRPS